jgi:hypothetical protein
MSPEVEVDRLATLVPFVTVTLLTPAGNFSLMDTLVPEVTPPSFPMVKEYESADPTSAFAVPDFDRIKFAA